MGLQQFIFELPNIETSNILWEFTTLDNDTVTGRVSKYVISADGLPMTIMIHVEELNHRILEIPWTAIKYIQRKQ